MVHLLVFYLVPAQLPLLLLPLSGFCTLSGSSSLVYSCGGALLLGWRCLVTPLGFFTLCQRSSPFCCLPLAGAATFLAPVCWSTPTVVPGCWVGGVFAASLGFLPCASLFLRGLRLAQLSQLQVPLGIFRSPGVCTSASLVTSVGHQPFPSFSVLLLLRLACRG